MFGKYISGWLDKVVGTDSDFESVASLWIANKNIYGVQYCYFSSYLGDLKIM
jgi:hypothetical protein